MKRIHVIAISVIAGFIAGCAVPAHAESIKTLSHGTMLCGSDVMTLKGTKAHFRGIDFDLISAEKHQPDSNVNGYLSVSYSKDGRDWHQRGTGKALWFGLMYSENSTVTYNITFIDEQNDVQFIGLECQRVE